MYNYQSEKPNLFTDEGQRMFLKVRDWVHSTLRTAGAFQMGKAMGSAGGGDTFVMIACVDRLVELGEIRLASNVGASQDWIYAGPLR